MHGSVNGGDVVRGTNTNLTFEALRATKAPHLPELLAALKEMEPYESSFIDLDIAKQLVWDEKHSRWPLVDWE